MKTLLMKAWLLVLLLAVAFQLAACGGAQGVASKVMSLPVAATARWTTTRWATDPWAWALLEWPSRWS